MTNKSNYSSCNQKDYYEEFFVENIDLVQSQPDDEQLSKTTYNPENAKV